MSAIKTTSTANRASDLVGKSNKAISAGETKKTVSAGESKEVVAALIWRAGRLLICRRPENKARALLWEFVGGKVEPGESKPQALIRECREELGITVSVGEVFAEVSHEYPDIRIHLTLFHCGIEAGEPQKLEHSEICWAKPEELMCYKFCPADEEILKKIVREYADSNVSKSGGRHAENGTV